MIIRKVRYGAPVALLLTVVACSTTATPPTGSPNSTSTPAGTVGPAGTAPVGANCAWANKADKATLNVAYPDTAATYWSTSYALAPGEHLELHGRYPAARYFSFITYGPAGGAYDTLTDRDIEPDAGSTNPFRGGGAPGGTYTARVRSDQAEAGNALDATAPASTAVPGTETGTSAPRTVPSVDRRVLLGSGQPGEAGVVGGTLIYRIYLPNIAGDPTGGGGLPDVRIVHPDGTTADVPTCANQVANPSATEIINANGPATNSPAPERPVFIRPKAGSANLYPNPDNVYIVTILHHTPGQLVVVRGRAPTFPDTTRGEAVTGAEQVRYWSLCTDEYRKPYPVSFCVADQDVAVAADGSYTFVISTAADRPANATPEQGVTWLAWGDTSVDNLLLLRHMLAAPDFTQSAIHLEPGALASSTMGPYAPVGVYCAADAFARGGPGACPSP
jgi:hypothetical protein